MLVCITFHFIILMKLFFSSFYRAPFSLLKHTNKTHELYCWYTRLVSFYYDSLSQHKYKNYICSYIISRKEIKDEVPTIQ